MEALRSPLLINPVFYSGDQVYAQIRSVTMTLKTGLKYIEPLN